MTFTTFETPVPAGSARSSAERTTTPSRHDIATRLLGATRKKWFDPEVEIDWDQPWIDGLWYTPPEQISLYGTPLWARMSEQQRMDLSRYEAASFSYALIWLELMLDQMLVRHAYGLDPRDAHGHYALTELADECRHTIMFGRLAERLGTPYFGPRPIFKFAGKFIGGLASGPEAFAAILAAEELGDGAQRLVMRDDRVQPLIRQVAGLHVAEEARHISYARAELQRTLPTLGRPRKEFIAAFASICATVIIDTATPPSVYRSLGLDAREARRQANASPYRQQAMRDISARVMRFMGSQGLLDGPTGGVWRRLGILSEKRRPSG